MSPLERVDLVLKWRSTANPQTRYKAAPKLKKTTPGGSFATGCKESIDCVCVLKQILHSEKCQLPPLDGETIGAKRRTVTNSIGWRFSTSQKKREYRRSMLLNEVAIRRSGVGSSGLG